MHFLGFILAEIIGDLCKKSMKSERKSKNMPGEIIGDFYQKPAKFEIFVCFSLKKSLVISAKNLQIPKKKCVLILQKSLVISTKNR